MKKRNFLWVGMVALLGSTAQGAPMTLIETSPGVQRMATQAEIHALSRQAHEQGRCGGYMDLTDHPTIINRSLPVWDAALNGTFAEDDSTLRSLLPQLSASHLEATVASLSQFETRHYETATGLEAAQWLKAQFLEYGRGRDDIQVEFFQHSWKQPSVIATIQGHGPRAAERVILGGHLDSINWSWGFPMPSLRAPGADDDASGIATVLEVFRVMAQSGFRPDRTIQFMGYAAEEVGLKGSQDIAATYAKNGVPVAGVVQFDMTFYPGDRHEISFITDYTHPELTAMGEKLLDRYVGVPWKASECGYACSDHASWNRAGYPVVYPFESATEINPKIHSTEDVMENRLEAALGLHFAKFGLAFAVQMGGEQTTF